jgi:internalin A
MPDQPLLKPRRRWLRMSVRGLIILVLVIGAGLGWIVRRAHVQRDAVAEIKKAGGSVFYDWEWKNGMPIQLGIPWTPRWLTDLVGIDYFGHVTAIWLARSSTASDSAIAQVGRLTRLRYLSLHGPSVGDSALAHLTGLTDLSWLDFDGTQVSDAGLAHLKGLTNLSELGLFGTHVTNAGLFHLKGLTRLLTLDLIGTQVFDAGIEELRQALPSLAIYR